MKKFLLGIIVFASVPSAGAPFAAAATGYRCKVSGFSESYGFRQCDVVELLTTGGDRELQLKRCKLTAAIESKPGAQGQQITISLVDNVRQDFATLSFVMDEAPSEFALNLSPHKILGRERNARMSCTAISEVRANLNPSRALSRVPSS